MEKDAVEDEQDTEHSFKCEELDACEPLRCLQSFAVLLAAALPNVAVIHLFSAIGVGLQVYNFMAPRHMSMVGDFVLVICACWFSVLFVFDFPRLQVFWRGLSAFVGSALLIGGAAMKGIEYPWASMVVTLLLTPAVLGDMRAHSCKKVKDNQFYGFVAAATSCNAAVIIALWFAWMFGGDNEWNDATKEKLANVTESIYDSVYRERLDYSLNCSQIMEVEPRDGVKKACMTAARVWFFAWVAPFMALMSNLVVAAFCMLHCKCQPTASSSQLIKTLKIAIGALVFLVMGLYCSIYASGTSLELGSALVACFASALVCLVVWAYLEVDNKLLAELATESRVGYWLNVAWGSNWTRAFAIGFLGIMIPVCILLDIARQRVRRCRGLTQSKDTYTTSGRRLLTALSTWEWCSILVKVNIIVEIVVGFILGSKVTFVFFSWLNQQLETVRLHLVILLVFFIGGGMFILPPVPGSAVYIFAGIVLGKKGQQTDIGFSGGVCIAMVIGMIAKLLACTGQYAIGYFAGQSVRVQKFVGVDSVPTRAIESILKRQGLNVGKVAILVGGPDWPTSVTCGILKVNIPQMLFGTLPVFFASVAPQTLAGALFTKSGNIWSTMKTVATTFAAAVQASATCTFTLITLNLIEKEGEELAKPRAEHEAVAELNKRDKAYRDMHAAVARWEVLSSCRRTLIVLAVVFQLLAAFTFAVDFVLGGICFRDFEIVNRISDSYAAGGLNGNVANIVVLPGGAAALGFFFAAVALHIVYTRSVSQLVYKRLASTTPD